MQSEAVYPSARQRAMSPDRLATRIAVICLEATEPDADREALKLELRQLQRVQHERRIRV